MTWYCFGLFGIAVGVLAFQLIWLPAPLVHTKELQWIEVVNWLYYTIFVIPSCWLLGAFQSFRVTSDKLALEQSSPEKQGKGLTRLPALGIMLGSLLLMILLLQPLRHLLAVIVILTVVAMLIITDLFILFRRRGYKKIAVLLSAYAAILLLLLCPTGYQVTYPAMTMNMSQYAHFPFVESEGEMQLADEAGLTEAPDAAVRVETGAIDTGFIDGVLVFERPAFPIDWLYSKLFSQIELRKQAADAPGIRETYSQVAQMKSDTNQLAAAMAWEQAGKGQVIYYDGAAIVAVLAGSPADGVIRANDVIVAINEHEVTSRADLQRYMSGYVKLGDQVEVQLRRDEELKQVSLITAAAGDDEERPVLGIVIEDAYHIELNQSLQLASYLLHAGGPSHGAMLTLALLDQLKETDITKGLRIAGTGTIEVDGTIGMVGGIPQKAYAVSRTKADVFFVPAGAVEAAREAAPSLNIVGVETFSDILEWLVGD